MTGQAQLGAGRVLLLVNLGSPAAPTTGAVRPYLRQFLTDKRVLDIAAPLRWLVGGAAIPLARAPRSAAAYARIWSDQGSPLLAHTRDFAAAVQRVLNRREGQGGARGERRKGARDAEEAGGGAAVSPEDAWEVQWCMRYGRPGIAATLAGLRQRPLRELVVVPMYPQQASSSTGTAIEEVLASMRRWPFYPARLRVVADFHAADAWVDAWVRRAAAFDPGGYDRLLFSYHGLPQRHIDRGPCAGSCGDRPCPRRQGVREQLCYRGACYGTTRAIAKRLDLPDDAWRLGFQSRLGRGWLAPFSDALVAEMARAGDKRLLVLCPSFAADCLETLEEVGIELRQTFVAAGGERLDLVPAPNAETEWAKGFLGIVGV